MHVPVPQTDVIRSLSLIQAVLSAVSISSLLSFTLPIPDLVANGIRTTGACTAVAAVEVDRKRRSLIAGEDEWDKIAVEWARLEAAQAEFKQNCEQQIEAILEDYRQRQETIASKLQEIEQEWQEIEAAKTELAAAIQAHEAQFKATFEAEWNRLEQVADELNAKQQIQEIALREERLKHNQELRQRQIDIAERERAADIAAKDWQIRKEELETQYALKVRQLELDKLAFQKQAFSEHEALVKELQHEAEKVKVAHQLMEDEFVGKAGELQASYAELQNEHRVVQARLEEQRVYYENLLDQKYQEQQVALEQARSAGIAELEQAWAEREDWLNQQLGENQVYIDSLLSEIQGLRANLQEFLVAQPFPDHKGYPAYIGNRILEEIREYEGILVEPHDCMSVPGGSSDLPNVAVWLRCGDGTRPESVFALKGAIVSKLKRNDLTMSLDAQGFIAIGVGEFEGVFSAADKNALAEVEEKQKRERVTIQEPTEEMLADALDKSTMYFMCGPTGAGKSAFTRNLLDRVSASLGENVEILINDIKFPADREESWKIRGQTVIPQYCDIENGECATGVQDMAADFLARKRKLLADARAKRPLSHFKKKLYVIDEAPGLISMYKADVSSPLKLTLRIARALDGKVCMIGQTPRCKDYGMLIPDMNNFTRFYLGADFAVQGLKEITVSPRVKARLATEVYLRQELAQQQIKDGILINGRPPAMFFALVATQSGQVFLMSLPAPGAYEEWEIAKVDESNLVDDSELPPVNRQDLLDLVEQAEREMQGETVAVVATTPQIDIAKLGTLEQSIVEFCLSRRGETFAPSEIYKNHAPTRRIVSGIIETKTLADRATVVSNAAKGSKSKRQPQQYSPSGVIKECCYGLVKNHQIGTFTPDGKRYGIKL